MSSGELCTKAVKLVYEKSQYPKRNDGTVPPLAEADQIQFVQVCRYRLTLECLNDPWFKD